MVAFFYLLSTHLSVKLIGRLQQKEGGTLVSTQPHKNPENGYAIRISKHLPKNAANLSYVHVDKPTPSKNINLKDYSGSIQENTTQENTEIIQTYINKEGFLEANQQVFKTKQPNILLTNEYANNLQETPLFYKYRAEYPFDTTNIQVSIPISGNRLSSPQFIQHYREGQHSRFVYEGEKVHILQTENRPLEKEDIFKVVLNKEHDKYYLTIYSAKELLDSGYEIFYPAIINGQAKNVREIMNLEKVYSEELQVRDNLSPQNYQVIENTDNTFSVKVDQESGNFLITEDEREPYHFQYQLQAKVKTRLGDKNPYKVKIGFIYINENVYNVTQTSSVMKKIAYNNPYMPSYLSFENPHPRIEGANDGVRSEYWEASASMPLEHWLDYDILIISGYGTYNMNRINQSVREYLNTGGILLVETAGASGQTLELLNNQITGVCYSKKLMEEKNKQIVNNNLKNRYYEMGNINQIGELSASFEYLNQESESDWESFIQHQNGGYSLMRRKTDEVGQLLYSNIGLMQAILFNDTDAMKLFINLLLTLLEEKHFITSVFNEFVYHKDDLYAEEYLSDLGQPLYVNDKSDEDQTQIVAKKIIHPNLIERIEEYLPEAYRLWETIQVKTKLFDEEQITLRNNQFTQAGQKREFTETSIHAIPGFRYISYEGNQGEGKHLVEDSLLQVKTTRTQAFFEQEVGRLSSGYYRLTARVSSESSEAGGFGVYNARGEKIAEQVVSGTHSFRVIHLDFKLNESEVVYVRLGAYGAPVNSHLVFSEIYLSSQGLVRMTPYSEGALYAYAITPKGKNNQLVSYEQTYSNPTMLKENKLIQANLRIRSFTYRWFSEEARYRKLYGNEKVIPVKMNSREKEIILGNVLEFLPPVAQGIEWSRKQNVYYEFVLEDEPYANISIYDPTVDKYFFTPQGNWILNHNDIWWNGFNSTVQVRLQTDAYHLLATNNQLAVTQAPHQEMRVFMPYTEDERDRWHLRVRNSAFTKESVNASELEELKRLGKEHQYDENLIGQHLYMLPEYHRQAFYPFYGERLITEERAVYVNREKIDVQSTPLLIKEIDIEKEQLTPSIDKKIWSSENILWGTEKLPQVYLDQNNTGQMILLTRGYQIDYAEGKVLFDAPVNGTIYASYSHDNFKIFKRNYENKKVSSELLVTRDGYSFQTKEKNLTVVPAPTLYQGEVGKEYILAPSKYWIDYKAGSIHFFSKIEGRVYADYSYYTEVELEYRDVNKNTGEIFLKDEISFKDEVYVTYLAEENTLEYKGYFDETLGQFIELDLNPTSGHQFDYVLDGKVSQLEGNELLDKEIYLYLLPHHSTYYKKKIVNNNPLRHVFHEEEWQRVKEVYPEALLIAQVQVRENTNKENIVIMDARRPGGGLKESIKDKDIEERLGYTSAFWDIGSFDGLAYYKNGVLIVQVPESVLRDNGGLFTEDEVREIVSKYVSYGVYPIIEFVKKDDTDIFTSKEGYYVIYEQPKNTITIDQYTDSVYQNLVDLEKEYFISEKEFVYTRTYTSEEKESVVHYKTKHETKTLHIELYADKELTQLVGIEKIPIVQDGKITIESNGSNEFKYIFRGDKK